MRLLKFRDTLRLQRGESLISVMASIVIASVAVTAAVSAIMGFSKAAHDDKVMIESTEQARSLSNLISSELKMMGSGMPISQTNFAIDASGLGDAPLPILTSSDAGSITFRHNVDGRTAVLTASYDPSATTSFTVLAANGIETGDVIYISNGTVAGTNGLRATVTNVTGTTVTITGSVYNTGATFAAGSIVEAVDSITYGNSVGGITRTQGGVTVTLLPNSTVSFTYRDEDGTALALPLTATTIADNLYSIETTVSVTSTAPLSSGVVYSATLNSRASLRNLIFTR